MLQLIKSTSEVLHSEEIVTLEEFRIACDCEDLFIKLGYDESYPIETDLAVTYHATYYKDLPCCYLNHRGMNYVFGKKKPSFLITFLMLLMGDWAGAAARIKHTP